VPTNDPDLNDHTVDLEWGFPATEVASGGAYSDTTTVSMSNAFYYEQSLPHELGHARYLIDDYGFNVHQQANGSGRDGIPQTENGATIVGSPFLPMVSSYAVYYAHQSGLMDGDDYLHMDRYSATALNRIWGNRATQSNANAPGSFGVFLNDLPLQNQVTLTDASTGAPLAGAQVSVYQSTGNGQLYGKNFSATPSQTLTADSSGNIQLGHNPFTSGNLREERHRGAEFQIVGRAEDVVGRLVGNCEHRLGALLQARAEHGLPHVGARFRARRDAVIERGLAAAEALQLREDVPDEVAALLARTELGERGVVDFCLRLQEAAEGVRVGHRGSG
jgi:hypothetical protein